MVVEPLQTLELGQTSFHVVRPINQNALDGADFDVLLYEVNRVR